MMRDEISSKKQYQQIMTTLKTINKLGAFAAAAAIGTGAATAATTYSKDGMQQQSTGLVGDGLPMLAPGVQSFDIGGRLNWDGPTDYALAVSYGRFFTSNVQVGIEAFLAGKNSDNSYGLAPFVEYNFLTGTPWVPYVGAHVGYVNPDGGSHSVEGGVNLGMKYFFRPNIAIFLDAGGAWHLSGTRGISDGFRKEITVGTSFYF
jgi:hypothetical protein